MSGFLMQTLSVFASVLIKTANFSAKTDESLIGELQTTRLQNTKMLKVEKREINVRFN